MRILLLLALLSSVASAQAGDLTLAFYSTQGAAPNALVPVAFPRFTEPVTPSTATYDNGLIFNDTKKRLGGVNPTISGWDVFAFLSDIPASAVVPSILLSPSATDPTTSTTGATYFNTSGKCLKTWNGTGYSPATCPSTTATSVPSYSTAPAGTFQQGDMFNDSTQNCTRRYSGTAWGPCLTTEACASTTIAAVTLPVLGATSTTTVTIPGALAGRGCSVGPPAGSLLNVGVTPSCAITAANTASVRFQGTVGVAVAAGSYSVCTHVPW